MIRYEIEQAHGGDSWRVLRRETTEPNTTVRVEVARYGFEDTARWIAAELNGFAHLEVSR